MLTNIIFFHIRLYYIWKDSIICKARFYFCKSNIFRFANSFWYCWKWYLTILLAKLEHHGICGIKLLKFWQNKNLDFLTRLVQMLTSVIFFHITLLYLERQYYLQSKILFLQSKYFLICKQLLILSKMILLPKLEQSGTLYQSGNNHYG